MATMTQTLTGSRRSEAAISAEAEAIRLAREGDPEAFEFLYKLHNRRVYSLCLRISGNPNDAEDLTQEAFLQLFRKIHTFRAESSFSTWLYRLTVNISLMRFRKKRHPEVSLDTTSRSEDGDANPFMQIGGPDIRLSGMLDNMNLSNAIDQLPDGYKQVFILHDVEGYEHKEIAGILKCSIGNSKSQLFKARVRLRLLLQEVLRSRARAKRELTRTAVVAEPQNQRFRCAKA
jgi:RNA polymerase sigma-70 factor, ECF subfamily